jgi:putative transposase
MSRANPSWGSPRIVSELRELGIAVTKSTVEKYRVRLKKPPSPSWKSFLKNRLQAMVALDSFTVPTMTFGIPFVLVILSHERRRVIHVKIRAHPTAACTAQQVVEAFPWDGVPRYLLRDRDSIYSTAFRQRVRTMDIEEPLIAPQSPWQNPYVERLIRSIWGELLDQAIMLNEQHLKRILACYSCVTIPGERIEHWT